LDLLLAHSTADLPYERCIGVDYQQLHDDRDAAIDEIVERYHAMAEDCDAVVIVGSAYTARCKMRVLVFTWRMAGKASGKRRGTWHSARVP
jgi:phosphate acetyltransferase